MHLINRDESRHIAIDFHMTELLLLRRAPRRDPRAARARASASWRATSRALATMMWHAKPFLQQVFLAPMDRTDPSGRRVQEAFKRIQLVLRKPTVARTPFSRFMIALQDAYNHPIDRQACSARCSCACSAPRIAPRGSCSRSEELARTQRMSFDELAEEALAVKYN